MRPGSVRRNSHQNDSDVMTRSLGLGEFVSTGNGDDSDGSISLRQLPRFLGFTGCTKLLAMIAVMVVVIIYGADIAFKIFGDGVKLWIPVRLAFVILIIPALISAAVTAKCLDLMFRLACLVHGTAPNQESDATRCSASDRSS